MKNNLGIIKIVVLFLVAVVIVVCGTVFYTVNMLKQAGNSQNPLATTLSEAAAKLIAEESCIKGGEALKSGGTYNSNSNTWWFDANLNSTKPGCNPACVVSAETKTAEINWRCTGVIPPKDNTIPPTQQDTKLLDLSNQGLTKLSMDIFNRTDLTELNVSGNKLTGALPAEIRKLTRLKKLDASDNLLTGVPAEIGQLSELEYVDFSNNDITGLPLEIGNLKNLKVIDLRGNDYSKYDMSIIKKSIPSLQVIE